jgi:hypothetical protein
MGHSIIPSEGGDMEINGTSISLLSQLVGIPHIIIRIEGKVEKKAYVILEKCGLLGELGNGLYVVKPECTSELDVGRIPYTEIARHPIPKDVRSEIRAELKKNGVSAPI